MISADHEIMTTPEVAAELRMPVGTLRYLRSCGRGPVSFRLGGRVRYRRAQVMAWVEAQEAATSRGDRDDATARGDAVLSLAGGQ